MADVENEVFTAVATALRAKFTGITVESVTTYSPSKFPFVCIEEADNYSYQRTRDSASNNNHSVVMYEVNAYTNSTTGKKGKCKEIITEVDKVMNDLGFTRLNRNPINLDDATKYRIFSRYTAVVSENKTIYRR